MIRLITHFNQIKNWLVKHDSEVQQRIGDPSKKDPLWERSYKLSKLWSSLEQFKQLGHR